MRASPLFWTFTGLTIGLVLNQLFWAPSSFIADEMQPTVPTASLQMQIPDRQCKKVFLDMGANIGMHSRFIFEPELYPSEGKAALTKMYLFFEKYLGPPSERAKSFIESGICVIGFEANLQQEERLQELNQCYTSKGWFINYLYPQAVWHKKGKLLFQPQDGIGDGTASHLVKEMKQGVVSVETIDIVEFMKELQERHKPDMVVGKLDIEGAEYKVLPALEKAGFLCADSPGGFKAITLEYHTRLMPGYTAEWEVPETFPCNRKTELIKLDSEDYVRDGQALCAMDAPKGMSHESQIPTKLCKKVFLDMGANIGMHSRFIFEPELYSSEGKAALTKMYSFFEKYLGPPDERAESFVKSGICVIGFEANSQQEERLQELNQCYTSKGWFVKYLFPRAVWHEKGKLLFQPQDGIGDGTASHLVKEMKQGVVSVETIDIVEFMKELQETHKPDVVVGKLDIEGAEYKVLPALEKAGFLCADSPGGFKAITLEYHPRLTPGYTAEWEVPETFPCNRKTELIKLDSEDYVRDGQVLCDPADRSAGATLHHETSTKLGSFDDLGLKNSIKIYTYNLAPSLTSNIVDAVSWVKSHYWGTEYWIPEFLKNSTSATSNPEEADLFLVPYPGKARWLAGRQSNDAMDKFYIEILDYINILPYFHRYHGKDHIFVFAGGDGATRFPKWRDYIPQSIMMTPESGYLTQQNIVTYAPGRDVLIPGYVPDALWLQQEYFGRQNRKYLFFYAGKTQGVEVREKIIELYGKDESGEIFASDVQMEKQEYRDKAADSRFCLIPRGISLWTSRFFELSFMGCIPVLIGTAWELPFSNFIPYNDFVLRYPESSVSQLWPLLSAISDETYGTLRQALKINIRALMYDLEKPEGSAFDLIIQELSLRAKNLRGMKRQAKIDQHTDESMMSDPKQGTWALKYPIRRLTRPPGFHYFGYFDKSPWSPDQTKILWGRVAIYDSDNSKGAVMEVGYTIVETGELRTVAQTSAFHYQQGCMLQWLGDSNELIVFNARTTPTSDEFCAHIINIHTGDIRTLPRPIYALSEDGKWATSLNMGRLHTYRLGYGYVVSDEVQAAYRKAHAPSDDGLYVMNMQTGESLLVLSIKQILDEVHPGSRLGGTTDPYTGLPYAQGRKSVSDTEYHMVNYGNATKNCRAWINHANMDRSGELITFLFRMTCDDGRINLHGNHNTQQFTVERTGKNLWRIPYVFGSHHDFGLKGQLLICDNYIGGTVTASHKRNADGTYNRTISLQNPRDFGHCSYEPTRSEWILSDTYAASPKVCEGSKCKHLFLRKCCNIHLHGNCTKEQQKKCERGLDVGYFGVGTEGGGSMRSDLHPRWSRDGKMLAIDSTHEAAMGLGRQMYVINLGSLK